MLDLSRFKEQNFSYQEIYERLEQSSRPHLDFFVLMFLSTIIASFGLLLNSAAVIIGAMLVAPLMDPILAIGFSSLIQNSRFTFRAIFTVTAGSIMAITLSCLIGSIFATNIGPTPELMARTVPNIMDLFVALAAGFLGGYSKLRKSISGTIFGAAIAIALIPPLCAVGLGLAFLDPSIYLGAFLLFLTNLACIVLSGLLAFMLIDLAYFLEKSRRSLIFPSASVVLLSVPLVFSFVTVVEESRLKQEVTNILKSKTYTFQHLDIVKVDVERYRKPVRLTVTVRASAGEINSRQVKLVETYLMEKLDKPVQLVVMLSPVVQIVSEEGSQTLPTR
jgi:uncharacterized hydrophobic protein (TIGR00271 family)